MEVLILRRLIGGPPGCHRRQERGSGSQKASRLFQNLYKEKFKSSIYIFLVYTQMAISPPSSKRSFLAQRWQTHGVEVGRREKARKLSKSTLTQERDSSSHRKLQNICIGAANPQAKRQVYSIIFILQ